MLNYPGLCKGGVAEIKSAPFHICKELTIIIILSGRLHFTTVAGSQILETGQTEILNVKEPVMLKGEPACTVAYFSFASDFLEKTNMNFEWVTYNCNICNFFGVPAKKKHIDLLTRLTVQAVTAMKEGKALSQVEQKAGEILDLIMEKFDDVGHVFSESAQLDISKERFQRISAYMIEHVSERMSLNDIAQNEYLSIPYLSKEFTKKLEKNYNAILNYYRTINAVIQLLDTEDTLTCIAESSGFSSIRYYNKVFKDFMGCLPSKFRSFYKGKEWDVTDFDSARLAQIAKGATDTAQLLEFTESHKIQHFMFQGFSEQMETRNYQLSNKSTEKKVILLIDDEIGRRADELAEALLCNGKEKERIVGLRKEVHQLTAEQNNLQVTVQGSWSVEIYVILS